MDKWNAVLDRLPASEHRREVYFRLAGDDSILVEYGLEMTADYMDVFRVQAAYQEITSRQAGGWTAVTGLIEVLPQWRSIQYTFDPRVMSLRDAVEVARDVELSIGDSRSIGRMEFSSQLIEVPLCWEHSNVKKAIEKYLRELKPDGAVNIDRDRLSNIPYLAMYNGTSEEDVKEKFFGTEYFCFTMCFLLSMVNSVPIDRRCSLLSAKYNPPRTWTARSTMAMGGFDVTWYPMEGAGGYQLLGCVSPVHDAEQKHPDFREDMSLAHTLDRLRFYEVDEVELDRITMLVDQGSTEFRYKKTPGVFSIAEWLEFETEHAGEIRAWQQHIRASADRAPRP